jgi:hypothetical protein
MIPLDNRQVWKIKESTRKLSSMIVPPQAPNPNNAAFLDWWVWTGTTGIAAGTDTPALDNMGNPIVIGGATINKRVPAQATLPLYYADKDGDISPWIYYDPNSPTPTAPKQLMVPVYNWAKEVIPKQVYIMVTARNNRYYIFASECPPPS